MGTSHFLPLAVGEQVAARMVRSPRHAAATAASYAAL